MFPITREHLRAAGASAINADRFIDPLQLAMIEFSITEGERPAMFLAQVAHESGGFQYTSEIWGPTAAQLGYEGRADLGNTQPGDGERFKGHGLIQITGRKNHMVEAQYFGVPFDAIVLWLTSPVGASRSAAHYWKAHGCNEYADAYDIPAITQAINGGLNGLQDRIDRYNRIVAAMV